MAAMHFRSISLTPVRYMIDGLDHDDGYRMVEDEFCIVASKFTRRIHEKQYSKLLAEAKANEHKVASIPNRPVVGKMTTTSRFRFEQARRKLRQDDAAASVISKNRTDADESEDLEGDLPYSKTPLHGLMASPRKARLHLAPPEFMGRKRMLNLGDSHNTGTSRKPGTGSRSTSHEQQLFPDQHRGDSGSSKQYARELPTNAPEASIACQSHPSSWTDRLQKPPAPVIHLASLQRPNYPPIVSDDTSCCKRPDPFEISTRENSILARKLKKVRAKREAEQGEEELEKTTSTRRA